MHHEYSNFEISRFSLFVLMNLYSILCYVGRTRRPPRISSEAAWASKDNFGAILCSSNFPRIQKIMRHRLVEFLPCQFSMKSCAIDKGSLPGPFSVIGCHLFFLRRWGLVFWTLRHGICRFHCSSHGIHGFHGIRGFPGSHGIHRFNEFNGIHCIHGIQEIQRFKLLIDTNN